MKKIKFFTGLCALIFVSFIFSSCYQWFEEKIGMSTNSGQATLATTFIKETKIEKFDVPSQIYVSKGVSAGLIRLSWNAVAGATSYRVEKAEVRPEADGSYKVPDEGDFVVLNKTCYKTVIEDKILSNPTYNNEEYSYRYFYRVSAQDINGSIEASDFTEWRIFSPVEGSDEKVVTGFIENTYGTLFSAPLNVISSKGESQTEIKTTWKPVGLASSYEIYRGRNENELTKIGTVTGDKTDFSDTIGADDAGHEFYYKVVAINNSGYNSALSAPSMGYTLQQGAMLPASGIDTSLSRGSSLDEIKISWQPVSGTAEEDVAKIVYALYRNSDVDSVYKLIKKNIPQETNSYTDKDSLLSGVKYYYYLQTVVVKTSGEEIKSAFSDSGPDSKDSKGPSVAYIMSIPTNVAVENSTDNKVKISFRQSIGFDYTENTTIKGTGPYKYNIYESTDNKNFTILSENIEAGSNEIVEIDGIEKKPYYKVSAVNKDGVESAQSAGVAPVPDSPSNVAATKTKGLSEMGDKWVPNDKGIYPVKITWAKPADASVEVGGYTVWRSQSPDSGFKKITDDILDANTFSYYDIYDDAKPGVIYYYKVISLNTLKQGKNSNNPYSEYKAMEAKYKGAEGGSVAKYDYSIMPSAGWGAISLDFWFRQYNKTVMSSQKKLKLMHKTPDTAKLGSETVNGTICGTLGYNAAIAGLGAEITMPYKNYCDFYIGNKDFLGYYYHITGNTDTSSNMSGNGNMSGTVTVIGMYPGVAGYGKLEIKGGAAGGGYYTVATKDLDGGTILSGQVNWLVGEEERN